MSGISEPVDVDTVEAGTGVVVGILPLQTPKVVRVKKLKMVHLGSAQV